MTTTGTVIDGVAHNTVDFPARLQRAFFAVNTVTNKIYVGGGQSNGDVTVIDGATGGSTHIAIPFGPWGFAALSAVVVNEVTNKTYIGDAMSTNLLVIDGVTNEVSLRPLDFNPCSIAINPASNTVYVSHCSDSRISIVNE